MRANITPTRTGLSSRTEPFFARVHEGYLAIAAREPQRVVTVECEWVRPRRRIGRLWRSSGES
jgi:thymidylate kinase